MIDILKSTQENTKRCRDNPVRCLGQVIVDAAVICLVFALLQYVVDKTPPDPNNVISFMAIFVPISMTLKAMDLDFSDQLSRVAGFQLGTKLFTMLTV